VPKIALAIILLTSEWAFSCPKGAPKGFSQLEKKKDSVVFVNDAKTATFALKCDLMTPQEAYKALQFFANRKVIDETTSYYALQPSADSASRIYFKVKPHEFVQLAITGKSKSSQGIESLEKTILDFINQD
jgi:hypothetical protein